MTLSSVCLTIISYAENVILPKEMLVLLNERKITALLAIILLMWFILNYWELKLYVSPTNPTLFFRCQRKQSTLLALLVIVIVRFN